MTKRIWLTLGVIVALGVGGTLVAQSSGIKRDIVAHGVVRGSMDGWAYEVIRIVDGPNICYTTVSEKAGAAIACFKR